MKKPKHLALKKFLSGSIVSLKIDRRQTGTESTETYWVMENNLGETKTSVSHVVADLVDVEPNWSTIMRLKRLYREEVSDWTAFEVREAADLAEYKRLRDKFG